jgi:glycosyltransferase involved in cell wall biosynthesis
MKIIYIANARIPTEKAHGYQICKMCEEFANLGHEVELWHPSRKNNISDDLFSYYKLASNFTEREIKSYDFIGNFGFYGPLRLYLQVLFFLVKLLILKIPADALVYTRSPEIAWLCKLKKIKVVYECHALPAKRKKIFLFLVGQSDVISVLTRRVKEWFTTNKIDAKKIIVSPDAVDLKVFDINLSQTEARQKFSLPVNAYIVGYTGNFKTQDMEKGISDVILAVKEIVAKKILEKDLLFVAVGGSEADVTYYKAMAETNNISDKCLFLPRTDLEGLAQYQKAFDALIIPFPFNKHYAYYTSPLKMFEYMAAKKPIIASDLPSLKEILDKDSAFFFLPGDYQSLARAIGEVQADPTRAATVASTVYSKVKDYSWNRRAEKIIDFINNKNFA